MRVDPATRDYAERRRAQGLSTRDIVRLHCRSRAIATHRHALIAGRRPGYQQRRAEESALEVWIRDEAEGSGRAGTLRSGCQRRFNTNTPQPR